MPYSERHVEDLRATVRVSDVCAALGIALKRQGHEYKGLSPFNKERTPSFTVNDDKAFFHDFSSGRHGDIFALVMAIEGVEFPEAVARVEQIGHVAPAKRNGGGNGQHEPKAAKAKRSGPGKIVATYDYHDAEGNFLYQVVRYEPKDFRQRRKPRADDPRGAVRDGWVWNLDGIEHTLYRLPDLLADLTQPREDQKLWFICEGEKDADTLVGLGFQATTNSGGAKHFRPELAAHFSQASDLVLLEDADAAGASRTATLAPMLLAVGARVRALRIADHEPKGAKDITAWIERGGNRDQLYDILDQLGDWQPPPYRSPFGARSFLTLGAAVAPYPWRIKGLIPARDNTLFMGPSRSGKTFAVLDLAMHVALGREKYTGKTVVPGGVAYLSYEGQQGFENRVRAYAAYHQLDAGQLAHFAWWVHPPNLFGDAKAAAALAADIKACTEKWALPLAAVVIDTHNSATRGSSEIKAEDISKILDCYDIITKECGAPLWVIGHTNKEGAHRGNEQFFNRIEATLSIERVTDGKGASAAERRDTSDRIIRRVKVEKQREGKDNDQWEFVLNLITLGQDADGDPITSMVACEPRVTTVDDEVNAPRGAFPLRDKQAAFFRALLKGIESHGVAPPADLTYSDGRSVFLGAHERIVAYADVSTICRDNVPLDGEDDAAKKRRDDAVRKWVERARQDLETYSVIKIAFGASNPRRHYIWPTGRAVVGKGLSWPPPRVTEAPDSGNNVEDLF